MTGGQEYRRTFDRSTGGLFFDRSTGGLGTGVQEDFDRRTRGLWTGVQEDKRTGDFLDRRTGVQGNGRTEGWGGRMEKRNGSTKNCESLCN